MDEPINLAAPPGPDSQVFQMDGLDFLRLHRVHHNVTATFLDPQYRGLLDKMKYGNEGEGRGAARASLPQMDWDTIRRFVQAINEVLQPSGHLFLWVDKFHLLEGDYCGWLAGTELNVVDMVTWDKGKMGMGYRTRRSSEYLLVAQKRPLKAKDVWTRRDIPDIWSERILHRKHPHQKPVKLMERLILAVTKEGDMVLDPAAGSFASRRACRAAKRDYAGCDILCIDGMDDIFDPPATEATEH